MLICSRSWASRFISCSLPIAPPEACFASFINSRFDHSSTGPRLRSRRHPVGERRFPHHRDSARSPAGRWRYIAAFTGSEERILGLTVGLSAVLIAQLDPSWWFGVAAWYPESLNACDSGGGGSSRMSYAPYGPRPGDPDESPTFFPTAGRIRTRSGGAWSPRQQIQHVILDERDAGRLIPEAVLFHGWLERAVSNSCPGNAAKFAGTSNWVVGPLPAPRPRALSRRRRRRRGHPRRTSSSRHTIDLDPCSSQGLYGLDGLLRARAPCGHRDHGEALLCRSTWFSSRGVYWLSQASHKLSHSWVPCGLTLLFRIRPRRQYCSVSTGPRYRSIPRSAEPYHHRELLAERGTVFPIFRLLQSAWPSRQRRQVPLDDRAPPDELDRSLRAATTAFRASGSRAASRRSRTVEHPDEAPILVLVHPQFEELNFSPSPKGGLGAGEPGSRDPVERICCSRRLSPSTWTMRRRGPTP